MSVKKNVWINGQFLDSAYPVLPINNRAFQYGDGLYETIHAFGTEPKHLEKHLKRIKKGMQILEIEEPGILNEDYIFKTIEKLLNKNRYFNSTQVRLTVFRKATSPTHLKSEAEIVIEAEPLNYKFYKYNETGLQVNVYSEIKKPVNMLSIVKSCNSLLQVKAELYSKVNNLDDCIIINEFDRIVETIRSNIFVVKENNLFTPSLAEGCIPGVMREIVCETAPELGLKVNSQVAVTPKALKNSDEVFIANDIEGIKWILGIGDKRYFNAWSKKLSEAINKSTFGLV
ncbi:MAG TPA: aminotransferase class IV [Tenuifilaceae bacterium]|nr:aminotransferase class IV [Tenuifilaceae bacterium]